MAERDDRLSDLIDMKIIVDCYDDWEMESGWHSYMKQALELPFKAILRDHREDSTPSSEQVFEVVELEGKEECPGGELWVTARDSEGAVVSLELEHILPLEASEHRGLAMAAWRYWLWH